MKKILKHIEWFAFAICLCTLLVYLFYTLYIKLNSSVVITDKLINSLKAYLIIALISLFIGLLIILIKKIYYLTKNETKVKVKEEKVRIITEPNKVNSISNNEKVIVTEEIKDTKYIVKNENMDEMKCSECGNMISKNAAICPYCGVLYDDAVLRVLKKYDKKKEKQERRFSLLGLIINIILIVIFVILSIILVNKIQDKVEENKYGIFQKQE